MLRFRPDIKPLMWGPPDAVRFAVRANCDRLGINYAAIDGYWPLLEFGGKTVVDIVHGTNLSVAGNADWSPLGVRVYSSPNSAISGLSTKINAATTSQTCLAWLANISAFSGNDTRIFTNRASWSDPQGFALETSSSKLRFRHNTPSGRVDILSTVDFRQGIGPVVYRQNDPMLFGVAYGPGSCDFFLDAKNIPADTVSHASSGIVASVRNFSIGNGIAFFNNLTVMGAFVSHEKLSKEIVEWLGYEPYTLLMPVARPVYFDLGSTPGGTPYTLYQDMYAAISWDQTTLQDAVSKISTLHDLAQDGAAAISAAVASAQDARASVSLVYSLAQDAFTAVSEDYLVLQDARATISEQVGYVVTQDALAQIREAYSKVQDARAAVSSASLTTHDAKAALSSSYLIDQDNAGGIYEYIVHNFDGISSFSTKIMMNHDHISKVSSKVNFIFDSKSIISSLSSYYVEMDSKASVSESVDITQDIKIDTSFAYLAVQDSRASISVIGMWKVFCDNLAKVHSEIITNEDLISKISCTLESSFDSKISSSSEVSINQDIHLTIKTALQLSFDSEGKFARTYEEFQEAIAGVSSGYAVIQDGKIHVIQVDFTQMAKIDLESFGLTVISTESETRITKALESTSRISIVKF